MNYIYSKFIFFFPVNGQDLADENELSSSISSIESSLACKTEELEISPGDRTGKPSPISILEPFFSDDDVSPARTVSRPGKPLPYVAYRDSLALVSAYLTLPNIRFSVLLVYTN